MTQFCVKVTDYHGSRMLNICDPDLLGRDVKNDELNLSISKSYYGEKSVGRDEAAELLQNSSIINMVGKETVSLSVSLGIGSEHGVKIIDGIPFLIVFKM